MELQAMKVVFHEKSLIIYLADDRDLVQVKKFYGTKAREMKGWIELEKMSVDVT